MIMYNSHGEGISLQEFIDLEVEHRQNYDISEIEAWMDKYNMTEDTEVIWATKDYNMAASYMYRDELEDELGETNLPSDNVVEFEIDEENIIYESDDGDKGYLVILNR